MTARPRIVIADPQLLMADALGQLLDAEFDVIGRVADGRALLQLVHDRHPQVAVIDVTLPLLNGIEAGVQAKHIDHSIKIVIATADEDPQLAAHAIRTCASAYLLKRCHASELIRAIHDALQNRTYVTPLITGGVVQSLMHPAGSPPATRLTIRQRQVLQLLAEGKSMKEAAGVLGITARTVAFHKYKMMEQMHITTNAELMRVAFRAQII